MLRKFFSKRLFSSKLNFVTNPTNVKNLVYFGTESDILSNPVYSKVFKNETRIKDFKKKKVDSSYSWSSDSSICPYSERLILASVNEDPEANRGLVSKIVKGSPCSKELFVKFSDKLSLHQRRVILNSLVLSNYKFTKKSNIKLEIPEKEKDTPTEEPPKDKFVEEINIIEDHLIVSHRENINFWLNLAYASLFTRNLANERGDPDFLESEARKVILQLENSIVNIEVIRGEDLVSNELNLLHAVGKSAQSEPRLIVLTYNGNLNSTDFKYAVVGKGVTFDTGGLNLKPTNYIEDMYLDKHGACNSLAVFKYVVEQKWPINLVCSLACAENSIDSKSYKPSDIITSHKGLTVEITNTDAEGRLCLADALSYVQKQYKPKHIIDLATLTGACMVALGNKTAGMFTNDYEFAEKLNEASEYFSN
jgi:leucyl aminopeptidase